MAQTDYIRQVTQHKIHGSLKCCWRINKAERHPVKFKQTALGDKSSLVAIFFVNGNLSLKLKSIARLSMNLRCHRREAKGAPDQ